jgi:hypothetical protein
MGLGLLGRVEGFSGGRREFFQNYLVLTIAYVFSSHAWTGMVMLTRLAMALDRDAPAMICGGG